jgi:hypothetical protein
VGAVHSDETVTGVLGGVGGHTVIGKNYRKVKNSRSIYIWSEN